MTISNSTGWYVVICRDLRVRISINLCEIAGDVSLLLGGRGSILEVKPMSEVQGKVALVTGGTRGIR